MPRRPRAGSGNYVYHVLNRSVGRATIFETEQDYAAFLKVLNSARDKADCRLLSFCIMPNHWHLVLWPKGDSDLSEYMHWLTVTHTQRWHAFHKTSGTGPLYQGRFKSFPIQTDDHFYSVCRYVERNALTANLASRAELWRWGSLWHRCNSSSDISLDNWPIAIPKSWMELVNQAQSEKEINSLKNCVKRSAPFGSENWTRKTADKLHLESSLQPIGRPKRRKQNV